MIFFFALIFILTLILILIKLSHKHNLLSNYSGDEHQKYTFSYRTPLIGGTIFFLVLLLFIDLNYLIKFFLFLIYIIGILSDFKLLVSPTKRFILQFLIIILIVHFLNLNVTVTRFAFLDYFLKNIFISLFFTSFCLLVVINGTNFIDGNNANVLGYYFTLSCLLMFLNIAEYPSIELNNILLLIQVIFILLIFNLFNKLYLGDSGAFLLGCFFGLISIKLYLLNANIVSSFFIVLMLWYPAFENLFSILRKLYFFKSPVKADNNHLHQLLYYFLLTKFKYKKLLANNIVGLAINSYNFIILFIGLKYLNNAKFIISLIIFNIFCYVLVYFLMYKFKNLREMIK
jgi:UDP-N-acetylmuramyl pentapeptide phosphotransferase/UDP-N-acetylglucosamine-1-phosphate transferase